jgi:hypothetical protein
MKEELIDFAGDVPGSSIRLRVLHFHGSGKGAPSAYLQASLHGEELPGGAALHFLAPMLAEAEKSGRIAGDITVVPQANPIGSGQWLNHAHMGRFEFFGQTNFNRAFPLLENFDTSGLAKPDSPLALDKRLKQTLLAMALKHEIVLDLHCDDESENYHYIHEDLWPHMADLALCLKSTAVILVETTISAAFDEACLHPLLQLPRDKRDLTRRAVSTVEFRGVADVSAEQGKADAQGLFDFLVTRGVIAGEKPRLATAFESNVTPISHVEVVRAPAGGMILFHVAPGAHAAEGETVATIVTRIGDPSGDIHVKAPQAGRVLTRRSQRYIRRGDDLVKILGSRRSAAYSPGALEAR